MSGSGEELSDTGDGSEVEGGVDAVYMGLGLGGGGGIGGMSSGWRQGDGGYHSAGGESSAGEGEATRIPGLGSDTE